MWFEVLWTEGLPGALARGRGRHERSPASGPWRRSGLSVSNPTGVKAAA